MKSVLRVLMLAAILIPGVAAAQVSPTCNVADTVTLAAAALNSPFALVTVDGECRDLSDFIRTDDGKTWTLRAEDVQFSHASVDVSVLFNEDPFITFGATTTNFVTGPVTYAFLFGTPIVPAFYNHAASSAGVSVSNAGSGTATVANSAIYPTYLSGYGTVGLVPTNLGVDIGTGPCVASGAGPTTTTCPFGSTSNTFAPTFYDNLEALITYDQTQSLSVASWSGNVTLDVLTRVPEPGSIMLLTVAALGLGAFGLGRRGR